MSNYIPIKVADGTAGTPGYFNVGLGLGLGLGLEVRVRG